MASRLARIGMGWLAGPRSHTIQLLLFDLAASANDDRDASSVATPAAERLNQLSQKSLAEIGPLRVTGLASGGEGVGRMEDGRVVFVKGGVPGDLVQLTGWTTRKKVARASIDRLIEASPDRVEPRCAHFGRCGGCHWQHIRYQGQLAAKRTMVRDALKRIGGFTFGGDAGSDSDAASDSAGDFTCDLGFDLEIKGSSDPYGYRARARLVESSGGIGYRVRGSRDIERIENCPILTTAAQDALAGLIRAASTDQDESANTDSSPATRKSPRAREWIVSAGTTGPASVQKVQGKGKGQGASEFVTIEVLGEKLRASSTSFMQGNALLWETLAEEVCRQCVAGNDTASTSAGSQLDSAKRFVELYAGIGFLTLPIARRGFSGVAIESDASALSDLAFNLEQGGLAKKVEIVRGRVEKRRDLTKRLSAADLLVVDPPRIGLESTIREAIAAHGPSRVVYVSCDPATLARDLRVFAAGGYRLSAVCAMDLFPQTPHVEVVARLDR
jgi:23S rRNA (uracil1939-C5)-methyltransferase